MAPARGGGRARAPRARRCGSAGAPAAGGVDPERVASLRMLCLRFGLLAPEEISTLGSLLSPAAFAIVPLETAGDAPSLVGVAVGGADRARLDEAVRVVAFAPLPIAADPADRDPERLEREEKEALEQEARLSGEIASDGERVRGELADLARRARIGVLLPERRRSSRRRAASSSSPDGFPKRAPRRCAARSPSGSETEWSSRSSARTTFPRSPPGPCACRSSTETRCSCAPSRSSSRSTERRRTERSSRRPSSRRASS